MISINLNVFDNVLPTVFTVIVIAWLLIKLFSFATKQFGKKRNKKAIQKALNYLKFLEIKFFAANRFGPEPSLLTKKICYWLEVLIYCLYSATFWLYALVSLSLFILSDLTGIRATFFILFIFTLIILGNMYRIAAHRVKAKISK